MLTFAFFFVGFFFFFVFRAVIAPLPLLLRDPALSSSDTTGVFLALYVLSLSSSPESDSVDRSE
jgi:hypothetical protein